ncbi:PD-(D/E)XK nuclease family protein [Nitrosomonas sp. Nm34]|uniref:PD-(D/E)XK nuclease family protein n=1 Tax=Nitrosomonas sp. Nm34 TaxID=1881055 RepID=UPI0008E669A7|nr:PD-(D/E)XK nuclease family protein [Nitrosomonas sp. Nm34]SFI74950.1 PD-(D/E)XK nuclease superfamily protein [Nitrosomonas sp. Nm34]
MSGQPFPIRASSLSPLFECAHRWEAIYIDRMRSSFGRRAALGTAIHAGAEAFDIARINGESISVDEACIAFMDELSNQEEGVDPRIDNLSIKDSQAIGIKLVSDYCNHIAPKFQYVAVEMETKPYDINCGHGVTIRLTGKLDRARIHSYQGGTGITDLKTGKKAVIKDEETRLPKANIAGHGAQVGIYELLYEFTTSDKITAPAEIIGMSTESSHQIAIGTISNAKQIVTGTDIQPGLLEFAADMFASGKFPPNTKSMLCSSKYCPRWNTCAYRER